MSKLNNKIDLADQRRLLELEYTVPVEDKSNDESM